MLIEQSAYSNRWRQVSPAAKGLFALCGMVAVFIAKTPVSACGIALLLCLTTLLGAGVPPVRYLRVAAPALLFLAVSGATLAASVQGGPVSGMTVQLIPTGLPRAAQVCGRSLGGLAALLFLALTTPLTDLIALLRRLKMPEALLDIMVLCYRMLFVFAESAHAIRIAQTARLGYGSISRSFRSLGALVTAITLQVWQRSLALHHAALARNNDGPFRFLEPAFSGTGRDLVLAGGAGAGLIALAVVLP